MSFQQAFSPLFNTLFYAEPGSVKQPALIKKIFLQTPSPKMTTSSLFCHPRNQFQLSPATRSASLQQVIFKKQPLISKHICLAEANPARNSGCFLKISTINFNFDSICGDKLITL